MFLDHIAYKVLGTRDYAKLFLWIPKVLLVIVQLWPRTKYFQIKSFIFNLFLLSIMGFTVVGLFGDLEFNIETIDTVMYNLIIILIIVQSSYKTIIIWYKASEIKYLLDDIFIKFWPHNLTGGDSEKTLKSFYFIVMVIMLSILTASSIFGVIIFFTPLFGNDRELPFPVKYSFDWKPSPIYELVYLSYTIEYPLMVCGILGTDCLFLSIAASVVAQYRILQECFALYNTTEMKQVNTKLQIINKEEYVYNDDRKDFFVKCLKHHQLLLRFAYKINGIYSLVILVQLFCSAFGLCLATCMITRENVTTNNLYFGALFAIGCLDQLLIYCIIGNELYYQASLLPGYIYESNWRNLEDKTLQRDVMFVIQHSQRTQQLTAYGLYDLNMTSYLKVLKLAFSFYTLLSTISYK